MAGENFGGDKKSLVDFEKEILTYLNFELSYPDPFSMLALYTAKIQEIRELDFEIISEIYYFGSYIVMYLNFHSENVLVRNDQDH